MQLQQPERLDRALQDWRSWPVQSKPAVLRQFDGGLNHQAWLVDVAGQKLVIKLFSESGHQAIETQQWAANLNLSPEIMFTDAAHSYAVMPYLAASPEPGNTRAVAATLRKLHAQPPPPFSTPGDFDLFSHCQDYLQESGRRAKRLHEEMQPILQQFVGNPTQPVYCHNDLVPENCLSDGERCLFIDWEFAALNNPWWDLASVIAYHRLDDTQASRFIYQYDEALSQHHWQPILLVAQCAVLWLER